MERRMICVALAFSLSAGVAMALDCYQCTYGASTGQNVDGCQGNGFNESALNTTTCANNEECFTEVDGAVWTRGCKSNCRDREEGANWVRCCNGDNRCNYHVTANPVNMLSQCWVCSSTTESFCENEELADIPEAEKISCTSKCFTKKENGTTTRGCDASCTASENNEGFVKCCDSPNLCNTSGSVRVRPSNLMMATIVTMVAMTTGLASFQW